MQDGPRIPWFIAEAIYDHLYRSRSQTLERIAERGGFGWEEVGGLWSGRGYSRPNRTACAIQVKERWPR